MALCWVVLLSLCNIWVLSLSSLDGVEVRRAHYLVAASQLSQREQASKFPLGKSSSKAFPVLQFLQQLALISIANTSICSEQTPSGCPTDTGSQAESAQTGDTREAGCMGEGSSWLCPGLLGSLWFRLLQGAVAHRDC